MTLTRAALTETLREKIGLSRREAKATVNAFFEEIRFALERGEVVKLSGFARFQSRAKSERSGLSSKTSKSIPAISRRTVAFRASAKVRSAAASKPTRQQSVEKALIYPALPIAATLYTEILDAEIPLGGYGRRLSAAECKKLMLAGVHCSEKYIVVRAAITTPKVGRLYKRTYTAERHTPLDLYLA